MSPNYRNAHISVALEAWDEAGNCDLAGESMQVLEIID